ncbi:MAG: HPF/RaiA family ribosome-associated protein [Thermodesulfobacteriota bacterium]
MQNPLQISTRNISLSEAAENTIREKAEKLDQFYSRIMSCRVMVETQHKKQHKGIMYHVRIDITVPGHEIVVKRPSHEDLYVAIRDSFDTAKRQIESFARKQRGEVKNHVSQPQGRVAKLFPEGGYGFLEGEENYEVYFHRNAVLDDAFDSFEIGTLVRYTEEMGENGPQASTVSMIRGPRE